MDMEGRPLSKSMVQVRSELVSTCFNSDIMLQSDRPPTHGAEINRGGTEGNRGANFKGKGKGSKKGKAKCTAATARNQAAEYEQARSCAEPSQLVRESVVATFLRGLGVEAEPLDLDGTLFFRGKSLVSHALVVPLKIAKKARHGLLSASQGGLFSVVFFELPNLARILALQTSGDGASKPGASQGTPTLDCGTARATIVVNTQHETDESIRSVDMEVRRLANEASGFEIPSACSEHVVSVVTAIPEDLCGMLCSRMEKQRELHRRFEQLLMRLRLERAEALECERRGLHPRMAEECLMRTWKGGTFRGVPVICDSGEVGSIDVHLRTGLLIPARNVEGLICGLQLRVRTSQTIEDAPESLPPPTKKIPKYVWVSRDKSIKGDAGVLPFFCICCRWSCREHTVALVEGGLKAYAFAFLARRFPVIGASGGQWHQCGEPLLHALARLSARQVLLFVDAGAVLNRSVLLDYLRSLQLLRLEWGVDVRFVWWEQVEKDSALDCDDQLLALRREGRFANEVVGQSVCSNSWGRLDGDERSSCTEIRQGSLEAAMLSPASFWAKIPEHVRTGLESDRNSRALVQALFPLLDGTFSTIPLTHRRR